MQSLSEFSIKFEKTGVFNQKERDTVSMTTFILNGEEEVIQTEHESMHVMLKDDSPDEDDLYENDFDSDSDAGIQLYEQWSFRADCMRSKPCTICIYLALTFMLLSSIVALVVIGVLIFVPYKRASGFLESSCRVVHSTLDPNLQHCSCGQGCDSDFHCIKVEVKYTGEMSNSTSYANIHENEAFLTRQCTFYPPCKSSRTENEDAVNEYMAKYGIKGETFSCLYNPGNHSEVIRTRRFHLGHVVHGFCWSSIVFLTAFTILILVIRKKGCDIL